ncbi:MAG: hypothetical protein OTI37_00130 [Planctomycetota bacterium]|nr:hypothetical protein [Planctomycetota bacterium]
MEYFFIAYLAMLVFLFTKLRRLQHSPSFQAAFGLLILVPLSGALQTIGVFPELGSMPQTIYWYHINWPAAIQSIVLTLSMFNLGRALFEPADSK